MSIFKRKRKPSAATPEPAASNFEELHRPVVPAAPKPKVARVLGSIPILGELYHLGPVIPKLLELLKDNKGKMSSKRFGAGALVASGIVMVQTGAENANPWQFYGGMALCGCGVVLFGLTRWEPGNGDDPPTASAS